MCGFAGFLGGTAAASTEGARALLERMAGRIQHRGPDHQGTWCDAAGAVALAHNRLAIVDLSEAGNQPMHSPSGRYVTVYNGEIYNHLSIRARLEEEGHDGIWRGHSDTETLLAAIETWGLQRTLEQAIGMFAFALWDRKRRELTLVRDRMGEKPVYYGWQGTGASSTFLFGSELKSLLQHPAFESNIDRQALALFMRHGYVPAPHSIYRGLFKLLPGTFLTLREGTREPQLTIYWSALEVARRGVAGPLTMSPDDAVDQLERLLTDAVGLQMMADVPLGAFLSGGVDSSAVVALMQAQSTRPIRTFSIGFHEKAYNEAPHAKAVAEHLRTDHTELYVSPAEARDVIPTLPTVYDEPFADSSQVPTCLVSALARRHVTVSLSGDAGDELFGGYNRYLLSRKLWRKLSRVPRPLRSAIAKGLTTLSPGRWNQLAETAQCLLPPASRFALPGDKIHKGASVLGSRSPADLYLGLVSIWQDPAKIVIGGTEPPTLLSGGAPDLGGLNEVERMMTLDTATYLPDDILAKVDRAAMSVSLETRVPFLDHRVVEFAWRLPLDYKLRGTETKWALRQVLYRHVPKELIERPKMGFGVPIGAWLRGPLRHWAEALLDPSRLAAEGFFEPGPIRQVWADHLKGEVDKQYLLWCVLMFQSWLEAQGSAVGNTPAALAEVC